MALIVEVEGRPAAAVVAVPRPQFATFELVDLRVDYDYRRQVLQRPCCISCLERCRGARRSGRFMRR